MENEGPSAATKAVIVVVALLSVLFLAGATFMGNDLVPQQSAEAPKSFKPFVAEDKAFSCVGPEGWDSDYTSAMGTMSSVVFEKGDAKIDVTADLTGSLFGDIARSGNAAMENLAAQIPGAGSVKQKDPVLAVHEMGKEEHADSYQDYEETPGQPIQTPAGSARISEFSGKDGPVFGKAMKGYRVTILGTERAITVITACPAKDWAAMKPAFEKVIQSVKAGG